MGQTFNRSRDCSAPRRSASARPASQSGITSSRRACARPWGSMPSSPGRSVKGWRRSSRVENRRDIGLCNLRSQLTCLPAAVCSTSNNRPIAKVNRKSPLLPNVFLREDRHPRALCATFLADRLGASRSWQTRRDACNSGIYQHLPPSRNGANGS